MNYLDLFSGIAGFRTGALWAGMEFENTFHSDIDKYANEVYKKRFPDSIQLGDIIKIDGIALKKNYGDDWILSGGFPCQDISIAGKGEGIHGKRSGLWFEYWRLIRDLQPRFAIMENVGMLVHRGLREVLGSLAEIGYNAEWQDIRAEDMGAPHKRERIWIVAYPSGEREGRLSVRQGEPQQTTCNSAGRSQDVADPECQRRGTQQITDPRGRNKAFARDDGQAQAVADAEGDIKRRTWPAQRGQQVEVGRRGTQSEEIPNTDSARLAQRERQDATGAGQDSRSVSIGIEWWATEPDVGRVAHGIPSRVDRLKCLGNSIVPQIAEILFRQIANSGKN